MCASMPARAPRSRGTCGPSSTSAAPGAVLDDHQQWLDRLCVLALSVEAAGLAIVAMVSAASVLTVIFTTRAGLAVHRDVIELLHMMGARDNYIARAVPARSAAVSGFVGGVGRADPRGGDDLGPRPRRRCGIDLGEEAALLPRSAPRRLAMGGAGAAADRGRYRAMVTARLTVHARAGPHTMMAARP